MDVPAKYNPAEVEDKWYQYWLKNRFFHSEPNDRPSYCIVIPPPNVTGVLHMGHMLNNTIQDVLVRRARMQGYNACWVPGTDHASIATEAKVVERLRAQGIEKKSISRDEFLKYAWEWKEEHGGIILKQLEKLGASCDWDRATFTMDPKYSESVIRVFVDLYKKDLIYRGVRMVNWDPKAKTAISDEEVIYKEVQSKLYYLRYMIEGEDSYVVIATTRPETILGDTAVCVNPSDPRYQHLKGKRVLVPLINRPVPVIMDDYVDMEFGTGVLKITPAHDVNDYVLGDKYNLPTIDIFNDDGTLNEDAQLYVGMDRFAVRKQIEHDLQNAGLLDKVEDYINKVGFSERTDVAIEPKLSMQWFIKMKELSEPALEAVMEDDVLLFPPKFKNTYRHWMENIKDWCISRQLWWGHRIPAWYMLDGEFVVAENEHDALHLAREKSGLSDLQLSDLRQDEDCLDTWFSSWLWPISVFDPELPGSEEAEPNDDFSYYYPTTDLVTAPEILFFWVARMIIAGYEWAGGYPFRNVYLTGIVRDKQGRKMSKSLGNSPDPIKLMEQYSADGVRMGMLLSSPAGNDILFDESLCEQGRNFNNKIWNAFRLVKSWTVDKEKEQPLYAEQAVEWFNTKLNKTIEELNDDFEKYRLSEALMRVYKLFWDEFSSWYLELVKPPYGEAVDSKTYLATLILFDELLRLLHPFMPFITEEIWHYLVERKENESIMVSRMPRAEEYDEAVLTNGERMKELITGIRNIRKERNIPQKDTLELFINGEHPAEIDSMVAKLANLEKITPSEEKPANASSFLIGTIEYHIPLGDMLNVEEELKKLSEELKYLQGFLVSVRKKLSNEKFLSGAPEHVVAVERQKQADAESKIKTLEERIAELGNL
ncbi:MAG: valine--tRNA ligase [Prevotellaceae bacterium]|jgi:valyl-tRNA synthetase|nr:valine--tRNA ligase [Prevotellaceae bacterium]